MNDKARYPNLAEEHDSNSCKYRFESYLGYYYVYILGIYFGDGYIDKGLRTSRLRIFLNEKDGCINNVVNSIDRFFVNNKVGIYHRKDCKCVVICCYNKDIIKYFPQHGKGKKHKRKIELKKWQIKLIKKFPQQFFKGLMDSDGCRYMNKVRKGEKYYEYLSYDFCNYSTDIIKLFKWICDILGIHYTTTYYTTGRENVRIRRRKDVKIIEHIYKESSCIIG